MENPTSHTEIVKKIILKHLKEEPLEIERMKKGIDNEVYAVRVTTGNYIVRLNEKDSLKGSGVYIPIFKSKGIKVPEIIAEDYSKSTVPYNYQILTKLEGAEIDEVISTLSDEQLKEIAQEIAGIIKKLLTIPTDGRFGYIRIGSDRMESSLITFLEKKLERIRERSSKTGVLKDYYFEMYKKVLEKYKRYFEHISSKFYFDDMASKNVIIHNGKLSGIVDLDMVSYGDFLDLVGNIKASWYGTTYGDYYANAVMNYLELNDSQREMVTIWALFNRITWQSEIGIQFNQNTSPVIDKQKVEKGDVIIDGLIKELNL